MLIITHDLELQKKVCTGLRNYAGELVEDSPAALMFENNCIPIQVGFINVTSFQGAKPIKEQAFFDRSPAGVQYHHAEFIAVTGADRTPPMIEKKRSLVRFFFMLEVFWP
jgi:ABC-type dipeptide/oligopeptide/nickel transport system ATPase component